MNAPTVPMAALPEVLCPTPEDATFRGVWNELPTPEWKASHVSDGFNARLDRLHAVVALMTTSVADSFEDVSALGEMLIRDIRGLRVLANRAEVLMREAQR